MSDEVKPESQPEEEAEQDPQQQPTAEPEQPYAELIDNILESLHRFFSEHIKNLLMQTDDYLFHAADHASSISQQNAMFEFMNDLRAQNDDIEHKFFEEFNAYLRPIAESPRLPRKKNRKPPGQLSLVDNDEMDEMVAMTTISSKASMDFQEEISHLTARMQQVAMQNRSLFHPEALKPIHLCDAFQDALLDSGFSNDSKLILYRQFDKEVMRKIKGLYQELNDMLIEAGVLPQIELGGSISHGHGGGGYDDYDEDEGQGEDGGQPAGSEPVPVGSGGFGGPRIGPGRVTGYRAAGGAGTGAPQGSPQGSGPAVAGGANAGAAGHYAGAPATGAAGPMGAAAGYGGGPAAAPLSAGAEAVSGGVAEGPQGRFAGMPLGQVRQSIQDFIGGAPADRDAAGASGPGGGGGYYSHGDVVGALSALQLDTQISDTRLEFNAGAIKKAVLSTIGEKEGGVVSKRVNQISEKTIDFIKLIFDAIIDDKSITDTIKTLLLSLQIPVIKAAMLDAEFFVDDKHPARLLLDRIAEAGVGVSEHKDPVYIDIEAVVRKLLVEYKEDVEAFKDALDALNKITDDIYAKARVREEESQKQVKHAHARNVVLQEIRKITLGNELPQGIRTLVLKVWPSLMFNHYLRRGKANDEWVEMLMILARIIDSVQPVTSRSELEELGLSHEDIVRATEEKLKMCKKSSAIISSVIEDLRATYAELMHTTGLPEEEPEQAEPEKVPAVAEATQAGVPSPVTAEQAGGEEETEAEGEAEVSLEDIAEHELAASEQQQAPEEEPEVIARRKIAMLPDDIQPGAWFIVYNGEDRPVRRLKLAVILMQDATLVFVDHLGNVVIEKDAEYFTEELERGLSGVIMQHSVFDHALKSALSSISR
jgi:hypothetical protein